MLRIHHVKHLAKALEVSETELIEVAEVAESYCTELVLHDKPKQESPWANFRRNSDYQG